MGAKVQCPDCGEFFEFLVDSGFCVDCFQERLDKEAKKDDEQ